MRNPATIAAAAYVAAVAFTIISAACGARSAANRASETRLERCIAAAGIDACRDLFHSATETP